MKKLLTIILTINVTVNVVYSIDLPKFKFGFGGGVNFSIVSEINNYPLYENISGEPYFSEYTSLFSNFGNQVFFHGEFAFNKVIIALKPGVYKYSFSKIDEIIFNTETINLKSDYLLRYLSTPVEAKWVIGNGKAKPFVGGELSYAYLLRQGGEATHSFIHSRFSGGPLIGAYFELKKFDIVFTSGYNVGLHQVSSRDNRVNASGNTPYSLGDIKLNNLHFSLSVLFSLGKSNFGKSLECPDIKKRR